VHESGGRVWNADGAARGGMRVKKEHKGACHRENIRRKPRRDGNPSRENETTRAGIGDDAGTKTMKTASIAQGRGMETRTENARTHARVHTRVSSRQRT
jgi:hypothetical protein